MIGQRLLHYEIIEKLGEGGMGVVYKARDMHLDRFVALKVLPPEMVADAARKARFVQEAKAASALNHPNIVTIFDITEECGVHFIAMEYVAGRSLAETLTTRRLCIEEVLECAVQIASALCAAHEASIVHRDLKPANIMVTGQGRVKLLDFGLAKLLEGAIGDGSETRTAHTAAGAVLGTPAYMSPEQVEGCAADARSDIFTFGALLYELVRGERAFERSSLVSTLKAVATEEPPVLPNSIPSGVRAVILRCLKKHPSERFQTARELTVALESARNEGTSPAPPSIAVLPFANLSADKDNEYFSDGLAEEIINALTKLPSLRVAARTSSFAFRGRDLDVRKVGAELNVVHLLEGSVRKAGDRLRVTAQLVNVADGYHLWSERYDRRMADIFDIQDEISQAIVDRLRIQLVGRGPLIKRHTSNLEAYSLYLKGRHWWNQFTGEGCRNAVKCFDEAICEDPDYPLPYAGLALAYAYLAIHGWGRPHELMPAANRHALKALELDETVAEAHFARAMVLQWYEWDWRGAEEEFRRASELNPADGLIHSFHAVLLTVMRRADQAIAEARRGVELEPISTEPHRLLTYVSWALKRFDDAAAHATKMVEIQPNACVSHYFLGWAHAVNSQLEEAIEAFQKAKMLAGDDPLYDWGLGYAYARIGMTAEAVGILGRMERRRIGNYCSAVMLAGLYGAIGQLDRAFEFLETAYAERDGLLPLTSVDVAWAPLHSDPRFADLMRRIGVEPP